MSHAIRVRDTVGWGLALWSAGYLLGILLFFLLPAAAIGWVITPIGVLLTLWVLTRVRATDFTDFVAIGCAWTAIAVAGDYLFIVRLFHPPDGYYKPDVYIYYAATLLLPIAWGARYRRVPA
jgi:hypothetical protein